MIADAPQPLPSKFARVWSTLRSLGVTPFGLVRRPRGLSTLLRLATRPRTFRDAHLIAQSGLFDARFYERRYPEVTASAMTPLTHFVLMGGGEGRLPNPLFDSAWYLARHPDVARNGENPLAHYLRTAAGDANDPHPLFSVSHYRSQVGHSGTPRFEPLQHYAKHGALKDYSPHPLFDPRYCVEMYGRSVAGLDPLVHFIESGAAAGFNPHPLFDVAYYRSQAPDARSRNPLTHYLETGSAQGLRPHPLFDPAYYLASHRDVAGAAIEPLTHFVLAGGLEGRSPIREFDSAWYFSPMRISDRAGPIRWCTLSGMAGASIETHRPISTRLAISRGTRTWPSRGVNPLAHYVQYGRAECRSTAPHERTYRRIESDRRVALRTSSLEGASPAARVVLCLTHVMPTSPRAGNEYRIQRLLRWLRDSGYIVIPVVGPIREERPTPAEVRALADEFGNAVVCQTDGRLDYVLRDIPDVLASLDGKFSERWATPLGEDLLTTERERNLLRIERSFCTDALIETVMRLQTVLGPYVLLAEYIWMSRLLPLVDSRALKIIDTIDVFSTRADKVDRYGVEDLTIGLGDERVRLERADVVIAIQENERAVLESLAPALPIITSGVDFDVVADAGVPTGATVLCVASDNPMNRRGLQDFIELRLAAGAGARPDGRAEGCRRGRRIDRRAAAWRFHPWTGRRPGAPLCGMPGGHQPGHGWHGDQDQDARGAFLPAPDCHLAQWSGRRHTGGGSALSHGGGLARVRAGSRRPPGEHPSVGILRCRPRDARARVTTGPRLRRARPHAERVLRQARLPAAASGLTVHAPPHHSIP